MTETRLHENQWQLIEHLCQYHMLDYPSCLRLLDTEKTGDNVAISYFIRPMVRHGYLTHKGDVVSITAKGRDLYPNITPLISTGGNVQTQQRVMQVSRVATWLSEHEIPSAADCCIPYGRYFVPSACWRKINTATLSTVRFAGMLVTDCHRLAVYDIGDGTMDWQLQAELSLFRGQHPATGMIFICHPDKYFEIAQQIIQHTMWNRKQLLTSHYDQRTKPVKWSRSSIKVRRQYREVHLTTPDRLGETLDAIEGLQKTIAGVQGNATRMGDPAQGDFECGYVRTFVNPTTDLLKYVYLFTRLTHLKQDKEAGEYCPLRYVVYMPPYDIPILELYPKLLELKEVTWYGC